MTTHYEKRRVTGRHHGPFSVDSSTAAGTIRIPANPNRKKIYIWNETRTWPARFMFGGGVSNATGGVIFIGDEFENTEVLELCADQSAGANKVTVSLYEEYWAD